MPALPSFHELFSVEKPLIATIHLLPLPGSPLYDGDFERVIKRAIDDAVKAEKAGVDAVIVENFGDKPFKPRAPRPTIAAFSVVVREVSRAVSIPVGVNVLRNDGKAAIAVAHVSGGKFIRVNVYTEVVATDQGIIEPEAWNVLMTRRLLNADIAVFADVMVKHGRSLTFTSHSDAARAAVLRGLADAIIVTGRETGIPPKPALISEVKRSVNVPVIVGSGVTPENIRLYSSADGFIVGTYFHEDGNISKPFSEERIKRLVDELSRVRTRP